MIDRTEFRLLRPPETHFRPASCQEVDCPHYLQGWKTVVNVNTELGKAQDDYIRKHSGREYHVEEGNDGLVAFVFPPGQTCFRSHRHQLPLDKPPIFTRRDGRAAAPRAMGFDEWSDGMNEEAYRIERRRKQG